MKILTHFQKKSFQSLIALLIATALPLATGGGCGGGGTGTGNPGNIALQSAPLAGSGAASLNHPELRVVPFLMDLLLGVRAAFASVSLFTSFKLCNDTLVVTDTDGETVAVNGSTEHAGLGILTFSPSSETPMSLTSVNIAAGIQIRQISVTSAIKPDICPGFSDAVEFDPGSGPIHISQNTAFKFVFATPLSVDGSAQTINLKLGDIVNGMVALGAGLNNSTIQNVNVGQAQ